MIDVGLGALAAVMASALFSIGLVVQSHEARAVSDAHALRLSLVLELLRRPRYVQGGLIMLIGFAFHAGSLAVAPVTVVQPALAAGLLVLVVVGYREDSASVGTRELLGIAGILAGLVALAFTAPVRSEDSAEVTSIGLSLGLLGVLALVPHVAAVVRTRRGTGGSLLAELGAGAGYALTGLTTKLLSDALSAGDFGVAGVWTLVTAGVAVLALLDQTSALQHRSVIEVGPIVYVVPVVVPVLLAPVLFGERWADAPHGAAALLASVAVVCAAAAALSTSPTVTTAATASPAASDVPSSSG